jgi:hypothetical protein
MLRSTVRYAAGLSVWTAAAVAAAQLLRLLANWSYRGSLSYASYLFNDVKLIFYAFVAVATFAIGAVVFLCTLSSGGRSWTRVLLLTVLPPALLVVSTAVLVVLLNLLQAWENGALVHPMALLSVFPTVLAVAATGFGVPGLLASAIWSWFFCRR